VLLTQDKPLILEQWPSLLYVPAVLLLICVLAAVTAIMDERDRNRRDAERARPAAPEARSTEAAG
jgi:hypothetical protein